MNYTTLAAIKADLEITDTSRDDTLVRHIESASGFIDSYIGYSLGISDHTESFDIRDVPFNKVFFLKNMPINSVSSVVLNERALSTNDYLVYPEGGFIRILSNFSLSDNASIQGNRILTVTYNAGLSIIPSEIEFVCRRMTIEMYNERNVTGNLVAESIGSWSKTYRKTSKDDGFDPKITLILDKYINVAF